MGDNIIMREAVCFRSREIDPGSGRRTLMVIPSPSRMCGQTRVFGADNRSITLRLAGI